MAEFSPASLNSGVEPDGSWMMVPLNGYNFVSFSLLEGKNLKLKYNNNYIKVEDVPDARPNIRILKVSGLKYGDSELKIENSKIDVSVKKLKLIKLAFNVVWKEGTAKVSYTSVIKEMVKHVNNILTPQANIKILHEYPIQYLFVKDNNIRQIRPEFRGKGLPIDTWDNVVKQGHKSPGITNVFFVMSLGLTSRKGVINQSHGLTYKNNIMIPKKRSMMAFSRTLAHEVIHALGFDASFHTNGTLMGEAKLLQDYTPTSASMSIPKALVNKFNP